MNFNLSFFPFIPWPLLWVAIALGVGVAAYLVYLNRRGWPLRVMGLALILASLANPTLSTDERQPLPDIAAVIVDESQSQDIGNRRAQTEQTLADVQKRLAALGNTEVRVGRTVTGTTPDTDGTRVFSALTKTIESIPEDRYAGAIIISDGQVHDVPAKLALILAQHPIHAFISGQKNEVDRRIVIEDAPRFAITGQQQTITFRVEDNGASTGNVAVTLRMPNGTTENVSLPPNTTQRLDVPIDHAGQNVVEIEAEPLPGEISATNNKGLVVIKGIRDRLRVLLVSGEPHPGERTWRNLLKSDPAVDLVHFTILRPPEKQDGTLTRELSLIAFPTRELFVEKLKSFDLVIFDRYRMQSILPEDYLSNVADYVQNGGALLIASGPDLTAPDGLFSTPLATIMAATPTGDITEKPFRPQLTPLGNRHPVSKDLPGSNPGGEPTWGRWFRVIDSQTAPNATSLLQDEEQRPLLVLDRVGEGRVAQFLSDQGWLWARGYDGGGPQIELLRRLAHWLMKEPDLEEEALQATEQAGNIVIQRRTMEDTAAPVTMKLPSGQEQSIALAPSSPGLFTARVPLKEPGLYTLGDGKLSTIAALGNVDNRETADVRATADTLNPVVEASRGGLYWIEDGLPRLMKSKAGSAQAGTSWAALRDNGKFRVTSVREIPLFATLASLAALLLVVTGIWFREGR